MDSTGGEMPPAASLERPMPCSYSRYSRDNDAQTALMKLTASTALVDVMQTGVQGGSLRWYGGCSEEVQVSDCRASPAEAEVHAACGPRVEA